MSEYIHKNNDVNVTTNKFGCELPRVTRPAGVHLASDQFDAGYAW